MGPLSGVLAVILSVINILLAIRTFLRERHERHMVRTHPLSFDLQAIAAAIRERGPDLHVRLGDVTKKP